MRKPIRIATVAGTAGVITLGGTAAAFALQGSGQPTQPRAFQSQLTARAGVSAGQARQIAQRLVPGARVTETELDHEHGRAAWQVDLRQQHDEWEVTIDAATGQVISVHHDSGMEEDD